MRCVSICLIVSLRNSLRVRCKVWLPICFRPLRVRPMSMELWMRRRGERLSNAFCNKGNERWEGGVSRKSVGKVKVKSKKSSNSLLFPDKKQKSCFHFQTPFIRFHRFQFFCPPCPSFERFEGDCFSSSLQGALRCDTGSLSCALFECLFWFLSLSTTCWSSCVCLWRSLRGD